MHLHSRLDLGNQEGPLLVDVALLRLLCEEELGLLRDGLRRALLRCSPINIALIGIQGAVGIISPHGMLAVADSFPGVNFRHF